MLLYIGTYVCVYTYNEKTKSLINICACVLYQDKNVLFIIQILNCILFCLFFGNFVDMQNNGNSNCDCIFLLQLGADPTESQALKIKVHDDLVKRWNFFSKEGLKKEDFDLIMKKYECVPEFEAPKLNPQISVVMKDYAITRDNHMLEVQKMASTALSILGSIVTNVYEDPNEGYDMESLLTHICDAGKIITAIIHKQTVTRKAFIQPGLSTETKAVLKDAKVDEFLFGKDLTEKIKDAKAMNRIGESMKVQQPKANTAKQGLNSRLPPVRRPLGKQLGASRFTGRLQQRVFLRNKQQFVNQRAQCQVSQKPLTQQDKKN